MSEERRISTPSENMPNRGTVTLWYVCRDGFATDASELATDDFVFGFKREPAASAERDYDYIVSVRAKAGASRNLQGLGVMAEVNEVCVKVSEQVHFLDPKTGEVIEVRHHNYFPFRLAATIQAAVHTLSQNQ